MRSRLSRWGFLAAAALFLGACTTLTGRLDDPPERIAERVKVSSDSFDGKSFFTSPALNLGLDTSYTLEAARTLDGAVTYYLDVTTRYFRAAPDVPIRRGKDDRDSVQVVYSGTDFHDYSIARDSEGNDLEVSSVRREFRGCSENFCNYTERFFVFFPAGYTARHAASGMQLRAISQDRVYFDLPVPANYVQGMLLRVEPAE